MKKELPFRAVLPESYEVSSIDYPVLYLLHGLFGSCDNWLELTGLTNYLHGRQFVVVLPEGGNKWYSDSATVAEDKFESSFISEFIPTIEKKYRVSGSREKRAIAGLSMGGFGALKFAFKRPGMFVFAGSMSGAFGAPHLTENNLVADWEELRPSVSEVFGEENNAARAENDLFRLVESVAPERVMPHIYFDCGIDDSFLEDNRKFAAALQEKNLEFEYAEVAGGHDWDYWDKQVRVILEKVSQIFTE